MIDKILLFPYWLTLRLRNRRFSKPGRAQSAEVPTICVGNITAGGTGKTPHTEMILRLLQQSDRWGACNLAVLSRGYKRTSRGFQQVTREGTAALCGDEPLQIKKKFPGVTVAVDRNRIEGCRFLCHPDELQNSRKARRCKYREMPAADLIVLDDAFQYRRLRADLNIVLVDYNRPLHKDRLLPIGRLRDLPERVYDADVIIVTKCPYELDDWEKTTFAYTLGFKEFLTSECTGVTRDGRRRTVLFTHIIYDQVQPVFENSDPRYIYSKRLILFSGIAGDTPLRNYLSDTYKIVRRFTFPDHHRYTRSDFAKIRRAVEQWPTAAVATTEKDAQRVLDFSLTPQPLRERMFQIPIRVDFLSELERDTFNAILTSIHKI